MLQVLKIPEFILNKTIYLYLPNKCHRASPTLSPAVRTPPYTPVLRSSDFSTFDQGSTFNQNDPDQAVFF